MSAALDLLVSGHRRKAILRTLYCQAGKRSNSALLRDLLALQGFVSSETVVLLDLAALEQRELLSSAMVCGLTVITLTQLGIDHAEGRAS